MRLVRDFPGRHTGFLLIDYPGYGMSEGRPNPQSILENSERALQALLEQKHWKLDADALCVLGHSLGGAASLQFAAKHVVRKILVVSTFTIMDDMVRAQIRISLGRLLRQTAYDFGGALCRSDAGRICPRRKTPCYNRG